MAITFDGQNDRITTSSQGLTVPSNVAGTFQAGGLAIGAGSTILVTDLEGRVAIGTATFPSAYKASLVVNGAIESLRDGYGEGGQVVLRAQAGNQYRWCIDNFYTGSSSQFRIFREDDTTSANGVSYFTINQSGNLQFPTAGTKVLNSSGNPILQQTGSVLQVIWKDLGSGSFSATSTSGTHRATGFTNSITPNASTSKILHIVTIGCQFICDGQIVIARGGTVVSPSLMDSYRDGITASYTVDMPAYTFTWLDSPATTSACNYELYCRSTGCSGTMFVGSSGDFNSSWTLMEVAA